MCRSNRSKSKPHFFWLCGFFIAGGVTILSGDHVHALTAEEDARTMTDITYMQEMTAKICDNSQTYPAEGSTMTLVDRRDKKRYTVAKIANRLGGGANCWMTQNLQLDLEKYWNQETMVTILSDVPTDDYWASRRTGVATKKNDKFSNDNEAIEYTNAIPTVIADGTIYDPSYGYYYSWCAATVGCKNESGTNPTGGADDVANAVASICPAGWQLPSGNTNGQWYNLLDGLNASAIAAAPYKIPAAGYMTTTSFSTGGLNGNYWSRTANSDTNAYAMTFYSGSFYPGTYISRRGAGFSVRCAADSTNPENYPEIPSQTKDSTSANFSVIVNDAITLASVAFSNSDGTSSIISAMPGQLATGNIDVNVGSNVTYKINLASAQPDLTSPDQSADDKIPAITTVMSEAQLKSTYGWGILKKNSDNSTDDTVYTGLTAQDQTFYTSPTPAGAGTPTSFRVGVAVPPTLPADTYSTEVTVTAIATE